MAMKLHRHLGIVLLVLLGAVAAAEPQIHVVQKGETLYGIARNYGISLDALVSANTISDPAKVIAGTSLTIPGQANPTSRANPPLQEKPSVALPAVSGQVATAADIKPTRHTVSKGETLYGIGRRYGVSVDSIVKANNLETLTIKIGQILTIPLAPVVAGSASAATVLAAPQSGSSTRTPSAVSGQQPGSTAGSIVSTNAAIVLSGNASGQWPVAGTVSLLQGKIRGAEIAANPGASLLAIRAGTVISAGPFRGFGRVAFIQAADGLVYVYGGAASLAVQVGDSVRKGSVVGSLGKDEAAAAYFFAFKGQDALDPVTVPRD
jgi:LysM repeat protein